MSPPTTILFCFFICIPLTNGDDVGASFFFSFFGSRSFIRCSSLLVPLTDERGHTLATTTSISHYTTSEIVFSSCSFLFAIRYALTCFTFVKTTGIFLLSGCISLTPERGREKLKEFVGVIIQQCARQVLTSSPPPPLKSSRRLERL